MMTRLDTALTEAGSKKLSCDCRMPMSVYAAPAKRCLSA